MLPIRAKARQETTVPTKYITERPEATKSCSRDDKLKAH